MIDKRLCVYVDTQYFHTSKSGLQSASAKVKIPPSPSSTHPLLHHQYTKFTVVHKNKDLRILGFQKTGHVCFSPCTSALNSFGHKSHRLSGTYHSFEVYPGITRIGRGLYMPKGQHSRVPWPCNCGMPSEVFKAINRDTPHLDDFGCCHGN